MAESKRKLSLETIRSQREQLLAFARLHSQMRDAVKARMEREGLSVLQMPRYLSTKSPATIEQFLNGETIMKSGDRLASAMRFAQLDQATCEQLSQLGSDLSERIASYAIFGADGVNLLMDLIEAKHKHDDDENLAHAEFAEVFGASQEDVLAILDYKNCGAQNLLDEQNEDRLLEVMSLLEDEKTLSKLVSERILRKQEDFSALVQRYQELTAGLHGFGVTKRQDAELIGFNASTFCYAFNERNIYRIGTLERILQAVEDYKTCGCKPLGKPVLSKASSNGGQSSDEQNGGELACDQQQPAEDKPAGLSKDKVLPAAASFQSGHFLEDLTVDRLGDLHLTDFHLELIAKALCRMEEARLTLQQLLRVSDPAILAVARSRLEREVLSTHDVLNMFASAVNIEELVQLAERRRRFRQSQSRTETDS